MIKPRLLRNAGAVSLALALSILLLTISARDAGAACPPSCFNPATTLTLGNGAANATSNVTTSFNLPTQHLQFGANVGFIPPEWGVKSAGDLAIGTPVGLLLSVATLGLLNGPCASRLDPRFDLFNGSVDTGDTISPDPPGTTNRLQPLVDDVDPANGIPDGADHYPDYLNTIFPGLTPRARLVGADFVATNPPTAVVLNFVIFEPGTQIPPSDLIVDPPAFDSRHGFPSVTVLQDPTEPAAPSPITDFCAPLQATTILFDNVRTNPGPGTYTWTAFTASQRDADGDGFENGLDTCPFVANLEDPKTTANPDLDGIDSACDPGPASLCGPGPGDDFRGSDCDGDLFLNRGDNCPLDRNISQEDDDSDGIGNVCDTVGAGGIGKGPNVADGEPIELCLARSVTIPGDGSSTAVAPPNFPPCGEEPTPTAIPEQNQAPECKDVPAVTALENTPVSFALDCVDPDIDDTLTCSVDTKPTNGTATVKSDCSTATYTPDADFTGDDSFTIEADDGKGGTATATVSVTVKELKVGVTLFGADAVSAGGSTPVQAVCAEEANGVKPVTGVEITFKIDPGSVDADLDGQAEVTKTSDADGVAEVTLNAGSSVGDIVVSASADDCGTPATHTITVGLALEETAGPTGTGAAGGADTGVGSLAPVVASIPAWAAIASGLGGAGLLGLAASAIARAVRRRR